MPFGTYMELTDPKLIRALAHGARTAILAHLYDQGPATATECAEAVGESPSACSYHLRKLAEFGFVEEARSDDGRERRWRLLVTGYGIPKEVQDRPEILAALRPWTRRWIEHNQQVVAHYLEEEPKFDPIWRKAATFHQNSPVVTPDELIELGREIQKLIEPYCVDPSERPEGAMRVHTSFIAVPRPFQRKKKRAPAGETSKGKRRGTG
jgi:DNA-binding transcriptional ArsR family regulator